MINVGKACGSFGSPVAEPNSITAWCHLVVGQDTILMRNPGLEAPQGPIDTPAAAAHMNRRHRPNRIDGSTREGVLIRYFLEGGDDDGTRGLAL